MIQANDLISCINIIFDDYDILLDEDNNNISYSIEDDNLYVVYENVKISFSSEEE